jgi:hypothetical protein
VFAEYEEPFDEHDWDEGCEILYDRIMNCDFIYWDGSMLETMPAILLIGYLPQDETRVDDFMKAMSFKKI